MNRTQVEVRFTDKLDSIRVDQREMEIPNAIKEKPIEEWFEATTGRVKWGGLGAEIKDMDFSGEKNAAYSFLFNGPEDKVMAWGRKHRKKARRKRYRNT